MDVAGIGITVVYAVVLLVPGLALGLAAGLAGWTLVAAASLLTYALAGLSGPLYSVLGIPFSPASCAIGTILACAATVGGRYLLRGSRPDRGPAPPRWAPLAHAGVVLAVVGAVGTGVAVLFTGIGAFDAVPQDWDAVFHANGIRLIADTGDGGLFAMATTNWYEGNTGELYYPNAYHLVASMAYRLSGASIPAVLDAGSALTAGTLALGLAVLVRRFGGRPLLAAASALAAVTLTSLYDLLWHGPVLPFAAGVVQLPVVVVLLRDLLDAPGTRAALRPGALFATGLAGCLCLHPAIVFSAAVMAGPALVQRWWGTPRRIGRELATVLVAGVAAAALSGQEVVAALATGGNTEHLDRPVALGFAEAIGQLITFGHGADSVQLRLAALFVLGLAGLRGLGALRWTAASAALFGALFVLAASSTDPVARAVSSIWWNDSWRLAALAVVPAAVVVGHGVVRIEAGLAALLRRAPGVVAAVPARARSGLLPAAVAAAVVLVAFVLGTRLLYFDRNVERVQANSTDGPAVSRAEVEGMLAIGAIVPPGQRVMNDRGDGSAWMYALTGLRPVAGHYDYLRIGPDAALLADRFDHYPDDPEVRAAVARLGIHYVQVDAGFLRDWARRQPGLEDLDDQTWLRLVYRNAGVSLYEIAPEGEDPRRSGLIPRR